MKKKLPSIIITLLTATLVLSSCSSTKSQVGADDNTIVSTQAGKIRGSVTQSGVLSFKGVPYAEVSERFVPAKPVAKWEGVRDATEYGKISPQMKFMSSNMLSDEISDNNCQNLNIWTPGLDKKKRAVMVWLHGGGFSSGNAQETPAYDGENLAQAGDVVVVSVNHRLNILGFFDLSKYGEKYRYSGNAGVQDIIDSLEWIKSNIANFGGDPNNVTVFGESGGGAKVLALMTSPHAKGLFHKGIIQSGSTDTMGVVFTKQDVARYVTDETLKSLGITQDNIEEIQKVPFERLLTAGEAVLAKAAKDLEIDGAFGPGTALMWEPVIDGDFMPTDPVSKDGFASGGKGISVLIGSNLNEWTSVPLLAKSAEEKPRLEKLSETEILAEAQKLYGDKAEKVIAEYKNAYPGKELYNALVIDTMIRLPILKITAAKADQKSGDVYSYIFGYGSPFSFHTFEIPYVFNNAGTSVMGTISIDVEKDKKIAELMSGAWISFAKTGEPGTELTGKWEAYTRESGAVMILDEKSILTHHHDEALLKLLAPEYEW